MKRRTLQKKLAAYTASSVVFLQMYDIHAQVIYTDAEPDIVLDENDEEALIDIDNNGVFDFLFQNNSFTYYNYSFSSYRTAQNLLASPYISNNALAGGTHHYDAPYGGGFTLEFPYAMEVTEKIVDSLSWHSENNQLIGFRVFLNEGEYILPCFYCEWYTYDLPDIIDHYFGIRFKDDAGENHYGWIRCDVKDEGRTLVIKDYAYEVQPDNPILAGDTVHYVSTIEIENNFGVHVYSYGKQVFINTTQSPFHINIFDATGKNIYSEVLSDEYKQVSLLDYTAGIYIVEILLDKTVFKEKIFIE